MGAGAVGAGGTGRSGAGSWAVVGAGAVGAGAVGARGTGRAGGGHEEAGQGGREEGADGGSAVDGATHDELASRVGALASHLGAVRNALTGNHERLADGAKDVTLLGGGAVGVAVGVALGASGWASGRRRGGSSRRGGGSAEEAKAPASGRGLAVRRRTARALGALVEVGLGGGACRRTVGEERGNGGEGSDDGAVTP